MKLIDLEPDVPVKETWEWLSDILVAYDGTEQRISLRGGAPRYSLDLSFTAVNTNDLNRIWQRLIAARNQAWVPEYHLHTRLTAGASSGATRLYFDPTQTDIREGESLYLQGEGVKIVQTMHSDGATITVALSNTIPKYAIVCPVDIMIIDGQPGLSMEASNNVGKFELGGVYNRKRATLHRPGTSSPLTLWNDVPVLDVRPLATGNGSETIVEDNITIDNKTSDITIINKWDQAKLRIAKSFLINRYSNSCQNDGVKHLDYWRWFFEYCRGSAKKVWVPTYRDDLICVENPSSGASSVLVEDYTYAQELFFGQTTHIYLEIETAQGTHRCEATGVGSVGQNTQVNISPSLPAGWVDVKRISFLIPSRLDGDSINLEHYQLHSILSASFRSAENE